MSVHGKSAKMCTGKRCLHKDWGGGGGGGQFLNIAHTKKKKKEVHSTHLMPKHLDFFFHK